MKIRDVVLTESVGLISDQDWQKLLSLLPGRFKDKLGISANRSYSVGSVSRLLSKIDTNIASFTLKWRDIMQQVVPLLVPYVLKEIDIDLTKQASQDGLDLSVVRLIAREFKQYIPELKKLLEQNRSIIVKKLIEFAENNPVMLSMDLSTINQLGLDWPELKTDVYRAYEEHLVNKFDNSYNIKTLYRLLQELKEHGHSIKDFPRLAKLADDFKYQLLFFNDTHISNMIWAQVESYWINVKRLIAIGLDWPELTDPESYIRTIFNEQKENTVRQILHNLKQSAPEFPLKDIAALRSVGVDWPELDVMERSLNRDIANKPQLNEAQQLHFDATLVDQLNTLLPKLLRTRFEYLNNRFYFGPFIDFMFDVVKAKFSEAKKQRVFELLEPVVLESIDSYISSMEDPTFAFRHFMDYFEKLLTLARYTDYDYSAVIDRNKASIMKMVLASVRIYMNEPDNIGHFSRYQHYVELSKLIKSWGLTWPELDTIVRSLASDRYIKTLNRTSMPLARVVDFSREMLRDGMTVDRLTQSAQDTIEQMKPVFMAWHTFNFKWRTNMHYELDNTMLEYFKKLKAVGLEWPEIALYINASTTERAEMQKRNIITAMIKALKENEWDDMPAALKELRNLGIKWSELDTIERSVNSLSNKQITETAMDDKIYQHHAAKISAHLDAGNPILALRYMGERYITIDKIDPNLRKDIESKKADIMRSLLKQFVFQQENDIAVFARHMNWINKVNLNWPELAALNRSVNSLSNKQITETAMDDKIYQHYAANIAYHLTGNEPLQALRYMGERDITVNDLDSDLRAELEAQKAEAVKTMLQLYKMNIFRFGRFLDYVNRTGLDWPELAVINRSFDAEHAAREDEFARHRNY